MSNFLILLLLTAAISVDLRLQMSILHLLLITTLVSAILHLKMLIFGFFPGPACIRGGFSVVNLNFDETTFFDTSIIARVSCKNCSCIECEFQESDSIQQIFNLS